MGPALSASDHRDARGAYDSRAYARVNHLDPHHLRRLRQAFGDLDGRRILEVGCGAGHLLEVLEAEGAHAVGLDVNPPAVEAADTSRAAVTLADAARLPFSDGAFDALVSVHTIEHLPALDAALREMVRVVRPGGRLLLIYPAEPIQGVWAIPTATLLYRNPLRARRVHSQKVTPRRLERRLAGLPVQPRWHRFAWRGWPQYASVIDRVHGVLPTRV